MGAFLEKPRTEKTLESGEGNGLKYGIASMQGWRVEMEDAHAAKISIGQNNGLKDWSFFGVFDGHAGSTVSTFCGQDILDYIVNNDNFLEKLEGKKVPTVESVKKACITGFLNFDDHIRHMPEFDGGEDKSGSTAVCALISPKHIFLINCGDSRAVLVRNGVPHTCTEDHKPTNPGERRRIEDAGGTVMIQRVNGSLAVSRAIGDFEYKMVTGKAPADQLVSPEPDVYVVERHAADEFLLLACDGIWDVLSNEEATDFVRSRFDVTDNLSRISATVLDTCLAKGSRDNMSVVLVALPGAPKVKPAKVDAERKLEAKIDECVKKITAAGNVDASDVGLVMSQLAYERFDSLPPGGGLYAIRIAVHRDKHQSNRQSYVEELLHRIAPAPQQHPQRGASRGSKQQPPGRPWLIELLQRQRFALPWARLLPTAGDIFAFHRRAIPHSRNNNADEDDDDKDTPGDEEKAPDDAAAPDSKPSIDESDLMALD